MLKAIAVEDGSIESGWLPRVSLGTLVLSYDERHVRRRALTLPSGQKILLDLPEPVVLASGAQLLLEDGTVVHIHAAEEALLEVTAKNPLHLTELAWHIGNRHLAAAIYPDRILIARDHVITAMLEGLGAVVREVNEPFSPVRGAYSHQHSHSHSHGHTS
ncbi:urease accessory protein UreE [Stenotrophomonas aracearum]|jgi:urease accessory protein|uniref:Urease accessory protein UreE n=1 Tax=Stenotrophomonas aracearum TaxID=3003272 RepID=A0ABY9YDM7_9GAMM|nr:urease accessory protein UreE [Stenotrophomonas sp. A5588]WNH48798.1 urease accessory protein UreE [Stenotrophomonas sp. A5588]